MKDEDGCIVVVVVFCKVIELVDVKNDFFCFVVVYCFGCILI